MSEAVQEQPKKHIQIIPLKINKIHTLVGITKGDNWFHT